MQCPACKSDRSHRSHRKGAWERLASLASYQPYRCHQCGHRFFLRAESRVPASTEHASTEREIRSTRRAKDWNRKRRDLIIYALALAAFLVFLYFITRETNPPANGSVSPMGPSLARRGRASDASSATTHIAHEPSAGREKG